MEPAFFENPYLKATASDSRAIRNLLDQQEAEYIEWRRSRKHIRHPFATPKLNSPLKIARHPEKEVTQKPLWLALIEPKRRDSAVDEEPQRKLSSACPSLSRRSIPARGPSRSGLVSSQSSHVLPSIQHIKTPLKSTGRLSSAASVTSIARIGDKYDGDPTLPRRKKPSAAKRRLQCNLYDFHSSIIFSVAPEIEANQDEDLEHATPREQALVLPEVSPCEVRQAQQPNIIVIEHQPEEEDPYVVPGLPITPLSLFDELFESDWAHCDVERVVRDAVERKRICLIFKHWYRVVVLYFRAFAAKSALGSNSLKASGSPHYDLSQAPNRLLLLEDINVPSVDPPKYGITDSPLRREGMILFFLNAARMLIMNPPHPAKFRMFAAEGIEISEAVRSLMVDHLGMYAHVQDPNHFRDLFLVDNHDRQGRRLRHILAKFDIDMSSFFFEVITTTSSVAMAAMGRGRNNSYRADRTPLVTLMSFHAFVLALKTVSVIQSSSKPLRRASMNGDQSGQSATASLDENRAIRIFQQCLDVNAELNSGTGSASARQHLSYPQFVEALLRVALIRKETIVCRGGLDVCPGQHTSDLCECRLNPPDYDLGTFDDSIEEICTLIHMHRLKFARKRSAVKISSIRSLQMDGIEPGRRMGIRQAISIDLDTNQQSTNGEKYNEASLQLPNLEPKRTSETRTNHKDEEKA